VTAQSVYCWATVWTIGVLRFDSRRGLGIFLFTTSLNLHARGTHLVGCPLPLIYMFTATLLITSRNSSVGIATRLTGWTIGVLGFDSRRGLGIFLFITASRMALRPTQPPIQWVPGALSLGVKRPGREADHSPPSSAEVKE
jgi:hypothetical protein